MKALSTLFVGILSAAVVNAPVALPFVNNLVGQSSVRAGETCTTDGKGNWECTEDDTSTQPNCVGKGPFE